MAWDCQQTQQHCSSAVCAQLLHPPHPTASSATLSSMSPTLQETERHTEVRNTFLSQTATQSTQVPLGQPHGVRIRHRAGRALGVHLPALG